MLRVVVVCDLLCAVCCGCCYWCWCVLCVAVVCCSTALFVGVVLLSAVWRLVFGVGAVAVWVSLLLLSVVVYCVLLCAACGLLRAVCCLLFVV